MALSLLAALGALLRIVAPGTPSLPERLDQNTLLYLGVAGGLPLLHQVKTFSIGQLKLEMIEKTPGADGPGGLVLRAAALGLVAAALFSQSRAVIVVCVATALGVLAVPIIRGQSYTDFSWGLSARSATSRDHLKTLAVAP